MYTFGVMNAIDAVFAEMGFAARPAHLAEGAAIYALARTYSLLARQLASVYQPFGLSAPSFNLLMLLKHGSDPDSFTQQAIGARLVVSPSDMTGLIDRLETKGLVRRAPGKDRRSKLLRITPKGIALLEKVWPHHVEAVQRLVHTLGARELDALLNALQRLREPVSR